MLGVRVFSAANLRQPLCVHVAGGSLFIEAGKRIDQRLRHAAIDLAVRAAKGRQAVSSVGVDVIDEVPCLDWHGWSGAHALKLRKILDLGDDDFTAINHVVGDEASAACGAVNQRVPALCEALGTPMLSNPLTTVKSLASQRVSSI